MEGHTQWIETVSGTRIAKSAYIDSAKQVTVGENCTIGPHAHVNGNVPISPAVVLGKYAFLGQECFIEPPKSQKGYTQLSVGNYSTIGDRSSVRLVLVGNRVKVGADCELGAFSVINDCVIIENDTVVPARYVVPPYSRVSGRGPTFRVDPINPSYRKVLENEARLASMN